ncbi:L-lactate dehydrogenase [Candidatus Cerribacteria bacterium 'Amazon FNV 2010 28 9']|uniref:L-lactate dehydrogenase n=1 Tax=Candidatus Cerribacteria bacterium 'Amazon FNV 2010 28 9' TaxID=2081795 RepID=A0A317JNY4_9BACT|nr:MAG: L-lactate dehydrogenase [Candidatus Cerribacteria bacterium 'Amazon FNV 2010 28 9']
MRCDTRKVSIIGLGNVGATAAYALLLEGVVDELVLYSRTKEKAIGEKLDLEHGLNFLQPAKITATDSFDDVANSDVIVITAGVAQKPGETRLDLVKKNTEIIEALIPPLTKAAPEAIYVIVSNPVDLLTYKANILASLPKGRVFGSGTMLDTARFRYHLSEMLSINPRSIHAYILGEHGDSSFPVLSSASVGGQPLTTFPSYSQDQALQAFESARTAAYNIIQAKGATYYAIGVVIVKLVRTILQNSHSVLPISIPVEDYYGQYNVSLSVPCIVGRNGVEQILKAQLNEKEQEQFAKSATLLKSFL